MLIHNRWFHVAAGVALSIALAACGGSGGSSSEGGGSGTTSTGGLGGSGGSVGGTGGVATGGGDGGATVSLADQGIAQNDCAPNDGAAIAVRIGTPSVCDDTPNAAMQVWFLAYPGQTGTLAVGDQWDYTDGSVGNLSASFWPAGTSGAQTTAKSGHLEVKNLVSADQVQFDYSFVTTDGMSYAGTATVLICASQPLCG